MIKKNATKLPLAFRMIQVLYPLAERLVPFIAYRFAWRLFFSPFRFSAPSRETKAYNDAKQSSEFIYGKKIRFYNWGTEGGPLICMVHGWSGRATQFQAMIESFVSIGCHVVAFDGPAHGHSSGSTTNVREFAEVLHYINEKWGSVEMAIGHSFGGAALLYAKEQGFICDNFTFIATPTIGQDILDGFLIRINGSKRTSDWFIKRVTYKYEFDFDSICVSEVVTRIKFKSLLLIHDTDDAEVDIRNARIMLDRPGNIELMETSGLGHTRILRNPLVIEKVLQNFLKKQEQRRLAV